MDLDICLDEWLARVCMGLCHAFLCGPNVLHSINRDTKPSGLPIYRIDVITLLVLAGIGFVFSSIYPSLRLFDQQSLLPSSLFVYRMVFVSLMVGASILLETLSGNMFCILRYKTDSQ